MTVRIARHSRPREVTARLEQFRAFQRAVIGVQQRELGRRDEYVFGAAVPAGLPRPTLVRHARNITGRRALLCQQMLQQQQMRVDGASRADLQQRVPAPTRPVGSGAALACVAEHFMHSAELAVHYAELSKSVALLLNCVHYVYIWP